MKLQERHVAALDAFDRDGTVAQSTIDECIWLTLLAPGAEDGLRLTEHGRMSLAAYRRALSTTQHGRVKGWRRWLPGFRTQ